MSTTVGQAARHVPWESGQAPSTRASSVGPQHASASAGCVDVNGFGCGRSARGDITMTRRTNARIAGATFLLYIAVGITQLIVFGDTTDGENMAARLATMATCIIALTLGAALYALTREEDRDLALLALACRIGEGVVGATLIPITMGLLSVATASGPDATDAAAARAAGALVLAAGPWHVVITASFFAVGSTLFCWLLLRGRMIPVPLAWLGLAASLILLVGLPLRLAGVLTGSASQLMWLPMLAFEVPAGLWLIVKGAAIRAPTATQA
jgi:hypothetical protein